jgi:hypothetical protein
MDRFHAVLMDRGAARRFGGESDPQLPGISADFL